MEEEEGVAASTRRFAQAEKREGPLPGSFDADEDVDVEELDPKPQPVDFIFFYFCAPSKMLKCLRSWRTENYLLQSSTELAPLPPSLSLSYTDATDPRGDGI
jgi:hypothetical protein